MPGIGIGLIGCGQIVQNVHLQILSTLSDVNVTALAEPDANRREQAQRRVPGAKAVARWEDLLSLREVDAVVICLPSGFHAQVALAALDAGKHVYLEKPIATNVEDGTAVVDAWRRSGLVGMIGFNYRFNPLLLAAKQQLHAGRIGKLVAVRSVFSGPAASVPAWKQSRKTGGGVLLDLASHHVDLARFLLGSEIRSVSAAVRSVRSADDSAAIDLTMTNGVLVQSFFSLSAIEEDRFEFYGTNGKLTADRYASIEPEFTTTARAYGRGKRLIGAMKKAPGALRQLLASSSEPSYRAALSHFAEAVGTRTPASPDLADGLKSLSIIEAAEKSARSGQQVSLISDVSNAPARTT